MDLEGIARDMLARGETKDKVAKKIEELIRVYRDNVDSGFVTAVVSEAERSLVAHRNPITTEIVSGIRAGEAGLGSRGAGDAAVHSAIFSIISGNYFEDAGLNDCIMGTIDGIHSRLSYFPFLAGFHATRASLRDLLVRGGIPKGIMVDIHLSDDSDIGMLYDFESGVFTVAKFTGVPVLSGSTLRVGGDVVIGKRITGGVAAVGLKGKNDLGRRNISRGLHIVMTEGHGGGTITSTAIYNGRYDVIEATLDLSDILAAKVVTERTQDMGVRSITDVTNGGLRGDATEIHKITGLGLRVDLEDFLSLIDNRVKSLLDSLSIDPLGVSIDSLLIFTSEPENVISFLSSFGIKSKNIGEVAQSDYPLVLTKSGEVIDRPSQLFRESPYTPVKAVVGQGSKIPLKELESICNRAAEQARAKSSHVLGILKRKHPNFTELP